MADGRWPMAGSALALAVAQRWRQWRLPGYSALKAQGAEWQFLSPLPELSDLK